MNRKEFIHTSGRYVLLALIALLSAFLIFGRKTTTKQQCDNDFTCGNCSKRDNCTIDKSERNR